MKNINPNKIPFGIQNAVLAFALDLAGVPMANPASTNLYSEEILFALGGGQKDNSGEVTRPSRFAGDSPEEAALKAFDEGLAGSVHYRFERVPELQELCKAFSEQEKTVADDSTIDTTKAIQEIAEALAVGSMDRAEAIVRLTCLIIKTYIPFKRLCFAYPPLLKIQNTGPTKTFDTTVRTTDKKGRPVTVPAKGVSSPGFKVVSLNASPKLRKKAGLK